MCPGDIQSGNIFISSLWVAQGLEVGNIRPCVIKVSEEGWSEESVKGNNWS